MVCASVLVLASAVHGQTPSHALGSVSSRMPRASALLSTVDMFAFWCKAEREQSTLCQQRLRSSKLGALQKQACAKSHGRRAPQEPRVVRRTALDQVDERALRCVRQILLTSADSSQRAALTKQRTAMIAEGRAHPIGSTRKEYLEMKVRGRRPLHGALPNTQQDVPLCLRQSTNRSSSSHPLSHPH